MAKWIPRLLTSEIQRAASQRPALLLTGARQTGKSSLLRHLFPEADYVTFDRVLLAEEAQTNPTLFLKRFNKPVILDEIQKAPLLFNELKILIDENREASGKWILTGSHKFELMKGLSESLAGRIRILELDTLSLREIREANLETPKCLFRGGYPELWAKDLKSSDFFNDYLSTYLERDLRLLLEVSSLSTFERFLRAMALRVGSLLNYSEAAKDVGISPSTAKSWVGALEASGIIWLLEPFHTNLSKRLVKAPKLYFRDQGLLSFLLSVETLQEFERSPLKGALWENLVFSEILRHQILLGKPRSLFFWRDRDSFEVDFLIEEGSLVRLIEAKLAERPDLKKISFDNVKAVLKKQEFQEIIACSHTENHTLKIGKVHLWNPISHPFPAEG